MITKDSKIIEKRKVADRTWKIEFEKPTGFSYSVGQYIWVVLKQEMFADSRGQRRAFSLISLPQDTSLKILLRESESGYKKGLLSLSVEDPITIIGPLGSFKFPEDTTIPIICIAGGVGISPFLPLIGDSLALHKDRKIVLIYANRSEQEAPYLSLLQDYKTNNPQFSFLPITGQVDQEVLSSTIHNFPLAKWFIVGPEALVKAVSESLFSLGIKEDKMVFEEFYWTHYPSQHIELKIHDQNPSIFFELAMEQTSNHVIITDIDGKILFANQAAEQITGYSFSEMQNQTPRLWGGLQTHEFYVNLWHTIKFEKKSFIGEIENRRKSGVLYTAIVHISPVIDTNGNLIGFIATEEDITKAKEVDRIKTEFISIASHQLRTPLGIMKWYLEALGNEDYFKKAPQVTRDYFDEIYKSNERVLFLVRELLSVSRIDQGRVKNVPKSVDPIQIVTEVVAQMQIVARKKKVVLTLTIQDQNVPPISLDILRFHEVIENLISNAIEFTTATGSVEVTVKKIGDSISISVKDTGIGISETDQKRLFAKFFRSQKAVSLNPEGSGLGLYLVKSYIEGWGGKITVESVEGKGSTFIISLPISQITS